MRRRDPVVSEICGDVLLGDEPEMEIQAGAQARIVFERPAVTLEVLKLLIDA